MQKLLSQHPGNRLSRNESAALKGGAPVWPYYSQCPDEPDVCFPGFSTACRNYCRSTYGKSCIIVSECLL
jgi:hypothetical protein